MKISLKPAFDLLKRAWTGSAAQSFNAVDEAEFHALMDTLDQKEQQQDSCLRGLAEKYFEIAGIANDEEAISETLLALKTLPSPYTTLSKMLLEAMNADKDIQQIVNKSHLTDAQEINLRRWVFGANAKEPEKNLDKIAEKFLSSLGAAPIRKIGPQPAHPPSDQPQIRRPNGP